MEAIEASLGMLPAAELSAAQLTALIAAVLWSLLWKGLALWRAARRGDRWWFIAFLFVNTLGILEIIYLFVIARKAPRP